MKYIFVKENICDGIPYINFYFTNGKSIGIDNCSLGDVYKAYKLNKIRGMIYEN